MEEIISQGKTISRTPTKTKRNLALIPNQAEDIPVAARTRSKSIHSPTRTSTEKRENSPIGTETISLDNRSQASSLSVDNPFGLRELQLRLRRITDPEDIEIIDSNLDHIIMANLTYTDLINAIPQFDGKETEIESFITTCDTYNGLINEDRRGTFLAIVTKKLRGEALAKVQPILDYTSWDALKRALQDKLKKPISFEYAQEKLINIVQGRDENFEKYAERLKKALAKLNGASRTLTMDGGALRMLKKANEKLAIRKFEQNTYNKDVKIMLSATRNETLEEAIAFALDKELSFGTILTKTCNYCKK